MKKKSVSTKRSVEKKSTVSQKKTKKTVWGHYCEQREYFFVQHRFGRVLLGLLIVSFAVFIAVLYTNLQKKVIIGEVLVEEGLPSETIQTVIER